MAKDYIKQMHEEAERRFFVSPVTVERRSVEGEEDDAAVIEGIAAVVNSRTDMGWFDEIIMPGAFDDCMEDDVRCLFNHNPNYPLARTASGTLEIFLNKNGDLGYRYTTPDRSYANDLADAIDKGDVSQSSFAFRTKEVTWVDAGEGSTEKDLRKIVKFEKLYDVSPVTYPAYQDTEVAKRSYEKVEKPSKNTSSAAENEKRKREIELLKLGINQKNK